jgi:hypothetical protein
VRPGYYTVSGFSPFSTNQQDFYVSIRQVEHLEKYGPVHRFWELNSVAEVLGAPIRIYKNLKRKNLENALCYVGRPRQYGDGWEGPPEHGCVFFVCVTEDLVVFEWGWERADDHLIGSVRDWNQRFECELWPN